MQDPSRRKRMDTEMIIGSIIAILIGFYGLFGNLHPYLSIPPLTITIAALLFILAGLLAGLAAASSLRKQARNKTSL